MPDDIEESMRQALAIAADMAIQSEAVDPPVTPAPLTPPTLPAKPPAPIRSRAADYLGIGD